MHGICAQILFYTWKHDSAIIFNIIKVSFRFSAITSFCHIVRPQPEDTTEFLTYKILFHFLVQGYILCNLLMGGGLPPLSNLSNVRLSQIAQGW